MKMGRRAARIAGCTYMPELCFCSYNPRYFNSILIRFTPEPSRPEEEIVLLNAA